MLITEGEIELTLKETLKKYKVKFKDKSYNSLKTKQLHIACCNLDLWTAVIRRRRQSIHEKSQVSSH